MAHQDDLGGKLTDRYDREARAYRELWAPILRAAALGLLREFAGARPHRIVDVGTGVGSLLHDVRTAFPDALVMGVDRSSGMLALAPAEFPLAVMDAGRLAIPSGRVDLVLMVFMLFHLEDPVVGLREARRALRRGGQLGALTWAGDLESPASRTWTERLDAHGAAEADPAAAARHESVDTPEKMESLLRAAGFTFERSWTEELVTTIELDHLIRLKTSLGCSKTRFDSLAPDAREECEAGARLRMERLAPEDFVARGRIVYSVASA